MTDLYYGFSWNDDSVPYHYTTRHAFVKYHAEKQQSKKDCFGQKCVKNFNVLIYVYVVNGAFSNYSKAWTAAKVTVFVHISTMCSVEKVHLHFLRWYFNHKYYYNVTIIGDKNHSW